ncbi:Hypothetical predicted protein [Pelobates cultripes]|uniref:Uncharacterized protein n=1 Tax=Pelobates cultripes TaxID=61616 RepID=A0AAD1S7K3_PELCU|nr:Hypothetical predicted protein [Pelobates cultripes]
MHDKAQPPAPELSPSDTESEMSSQALTDRAEAPLTRRDMRGFRSSVAEELDKRLSPIMENMADLTARAQEVEDNMAEVQDSVHTHEGALKDLRDQLRALEDANEDLRNRTCQNNIRVRGIPEAVTVELLPDTLQNVFTQLLPEATAAELLMDRAHRALRAPSAATTTLRDVIVQMHFYHIKDRLMKAARETPWRWKERRSNSIKTWRQLPSRDAGISGH